MLDSTLNKPDTNEGLNKEIDINDVKISKVPSLFENLKDIFIYLCVSLIIILAIRLFVVQHVRVEGTSMEPTLHNGQHLLIEKLSYKFKDVERFDIVVFQPFYEDKDTFYVKRIIGLPGETVQTKDNVIYMNTFSKTVSSSLRVGYMVLPKHLVSLFNEKLGFYSCTVPTFIQYVLAELILGGDFERHINRVRRKKRKEINGK